MTLSRQNSLTQHGQGDILGMDSTRPRALRFADRSGFAHHDRREDAIFKIMPLQEGNFFLDYRANKW